MRIQHADSREIEILKLLGHEPRSVLAVGDSSALALSEIEKRYPNASVACVRVSDRQAIELDAAALRDSAVDVVVLINVLAELRDPLQCMMTLRPFLSRDVQVLASIPNVRNLWLLAELVSGRWDCADGDLLDSRRIRFFSLKTITELFAAAGYAIDRLDQIDDIRIPWIPPQSGAMNIDTEIMTLKTLDAQDVRELRALEFLISAKLR